MKDLNEIPTGVMFHHFHSDQHLPSQGSISEDQFDRLIVNLKRDYNLLNAKEWAEKAKKGTLKKSDTCITFDDTLLCQTDIALPVLEKHNLTAFWFLCSSFLKKETVYLEIFRLFRTKCFSSIEDFYSEFTKTAILEYPETETTYREFNPDNYLKEFPFYTDEDKKFRFLRDQLLTPKTYESLMITLMDLKNFDIEGNKDHLWFGPEVAKELIKKDHIIGLHSSTHPTQLCKLSREDQYKEYHYNLNYIKEKLDGYTPDTMSHPCNSYSKDTIEILTELGITIGFRSNMNHSNTHGPLEYAREDHSNLITRYNLK